MAANENKRTSLWVAGTSALMLALFVLALPTTQAGAKPAKKVTVTFNAAGGKIGAKATVKKKVIKGKKVGKLPVAKRAAYSFKGWYTKRSGGKKIAAGSKVRAKSIFYARWIRVLSAADKRLVGKWSSRRDTPFENTNRRIEFFANGTFLFEYRFILNGVGHVTEDRGDFVARSGKIFGTNIKHTFLKTKGTGTYKDKPGNDLVWDYEFADRPYNFETDNEAWLNGSPWLNIKMSIGWESFQKPEPSTFDQD